MPRLQSLLSWALAGGWEPTSLVLVCWVRWKNLGCWMLSHTSQGSLGPLDKCWVWMQGCTMCSIRMRWCLPPVTKYKLSLIFFFLNGQMIFVYFMLYGVIPDKCNLKEGKVYIGSQLESIVCYGRKGPLWSKGKCACSICPVWVQPGKWHGHIQGVSFYPILMCFSTLLQTHRDLSLLVGWVVWALHTCVEACWG